MSAIRLPHWLPALALLLFAHAAPARQGEPPYSLAHPAKAGFEVPTLDLRALDAAAERAADAASAAAGSVASKRLRSARDEAIAITPAQTGRWERLDDGSRLWRLRLRAAGATDLRIGLSRFAPPEGTTLHVIGADAWFQGPYVASDANAHGLSLPVVPGDTATVELRMPPGSELAADAVMLAHVGAGFRDLFGREAPKAVNGLGDSGACNIDVACPLGESYPDEISATGHYEFLSGGTWYICTGTLIANVPRDRRNLFLTAQHCIASASEAASIVVYWNYQSTRCGTLSAPGGGWLNDNQQGSRLLAMRADTDVTLLELLQEPDPDWNLYYAGWDAGGAAPSATIGIHHPRGDAKKITAGPAPSTMGNCIASGYTATHWRAGPYSQGTTEGGSSGSALFGAAGSSSARRVIGTLSGGTAACGVGAPNQPNDGYDCYGKLSQAWDGASASTRLRDWLDPANTGTRSVSGIAQGDDGGGDPGILPPRRPYPQDLLHSRRRR